MIGQITDLDQYRAGPWGPPAPGHPAFMRTLWAPYDDVHAALLALAGTATRELVVAMFGFTDTELGAVVEGKLNDPGIRCEVTLDKSQASGPTERRMLDTLGMLESNTVAVGTSEKSAIMHRKVMIVDRRWLVTGSTNWSLSAETRQDNQLTVVDDPVSAAEAGMVLALEHEKARTQMAKAAGRG
ncbi:hypothetical protein SCMU_14460 [Sinomonas cyclohexanicum]|uniref:phospholipase D n=1 Tax=Sinomonas cyclohexanicum TaxID=322009 RepID=A0ABN6FG23_SINCY|nr:phospholipase D-like domain-containing protein [Corynebacterium cyclohexanicum]BCT75604.1 hypothetical protein SCMU_14460 [Corynebacterium cyclohexanicum]